MNFELESPWMLALLVLLPAALIVLRFTLVDSSRAQFALSALTRCVILALLAFALAGAMRIKKSRDVTILVAADLSDSVSDKAREQLAAFLPQLKDRMDASSKAGLVVFGEAPKLVASITAAPEFPETIEKIAKGEKIAVMFGPERSGLENDDIAKANAIISVPVNPLYASLNLAQCVLLTAYEWRRQTVEVEAQFTELGGTQWATSIEMEKLAEHYEGRLDDAGFFYPPEKADGMKTNLRNLWSRLPLTRADVQMMHGILRQMVRWKDRGDT